MQHYTTLTNSEIADRISERIHSKKYREILHLKLIDGLSCGSEKIKPLTYKEAQEWAEVHLDGEDYCAIFGEPDENEEDVLLGIRVSAAAAAKLKRIAAET